MGSFQPWKNPTVSNQNNVDQNSMMPTRVSQKAQVFTNTASQCKISPVLLLLTSPAYDTRGEISQTTSESFFLQPSVTNISMLANSTSVHLTLYHQTSARVCERFSL